MIFEESLKKLEQVLEELQKNDLSLEKSLELYDEGKKLLEICQKQLDEAKLKISFKE